MTIWFEKRRNSRMMHHPLAIAVWLIIVPCALSQTQTPTAANDCPSFLDALQSDNVEFILLTDSIHCQVEDISQTIILQRDVQIAGETNSQDEAKPVLSLPSHSSGLFEVGANQTLLLSNFAIAQDLGLETIVEGDIHLNEGAVLVLRQASLLYADCDQTTYSWNATLAAVERPMAFLNSQDVEVIDDETVFVKSLAMENSERFGSSYRFVCNSIYLCNANASRESSVWHDVAQDLSIDCREALKSSDTRSLLLLDTLSFTELLFLSVAIGICLPFLLLLVIYIVYKCTVLKRQKYHESKPLGQNEDLELETGKAVEVNEIEIEMQRRLQEQDLLDLEVVELLGKGAFGSVYRCRWRGTTTALKIIDHLEDLLQSGHTSLEALVSKTIAHPNMVQTFLVKTVPFGELCVKGLDVLETAPCRGSESEDDEFQTLVNESLSTATHQTLILMEYCDRGSLAQEIHKGSFNKANAMERLILTALDIAHAISYLHSLGIIHGDLKAANVLLKTDSTDPRGFVCKVSDFGLARVQSAEGQDTAFKHGTVTHMSPELLTEGKLTHAVDAYSFGMLLWELIAAEQPFPNKTQSEILLAIANGHRPGIPDNCPPGYANLISFCWRQDYEQRPSLKEIVKRLQRISQALQRFDTNKSASRTTKH